MENGTRPIPDPTVLTTEQLHREIKSLKDLLAAESIGNKLLIEEKFKSVEVQLALLERQRVELKKDTKDAVDAALAAAKEAVKEQTISSDRAISKSEVATAKQLEQQGTTFTTVVAGMTASHDDLKERVGKLESVGVGEIRQRTETRQGNADARDFKGLVLVIIGLAVSIITSLISLVLVVTA